VIGTDCKKFYKEKVNFTKDVFSNKVEEAFRQGRIFSPSSLFEMEIQSLLSPSQPCLLLGASNKDKFTNF
jgi:hypothetical protein